jgi:tetratricopeptide (TPR) repeat protein
MDAGKPAPDCAPSVSAIPVPDIVEELDALLNHGSIVVARRLLEHWLGAARACGDWRGELSMQSELMGLHRRTGDEQAAMEAVEGGLAVIEAHGLGATVSGATVMLNAATTLKAFGKADKSLPLFSRVSRIYSEKLDPFDYRFGGLYNNMPLSYEDMGDFEAAQEYFMRAMSVISTCPSPENELAVTCCNLAELCEHSEAEDPRINEWMERAWEYLNSPTLPRDGYHAFTASKCAPTFGHFGFFLYEKELLERAKEIYERT